MPLADQISVERQGQSNLSERDELSKEIEIDLLKDRLVAASQSSLTEMSAALIRTLRRTLSPRWKETQESLSHRAINIVSLEFSRPPQLLTALNALGMEEKATQTLARQGISLERLLETEPEIECALGAHGRIASHLLDQLLTENMPVFGHTLGYDFGAPCQSIDDGWPVMQPRHQWSAIASGWIVEREGRVAVRFGGKVERSGERGPREQSKWSYKTCLEGVPYDMPVLPATLPAALPATIHRSHSSAVSPVAEERDSGDLAGGDSAQRSALELDDTARSALLSEQLQIGTVQIGTMRWWRARPVEQFERAIFSVNDYAAATNDLRFAKNISNALVFVDNKAPDSLEIRFLQSYFLAVCVVQDALMTLHDSGHSLDALSERHLFHGLGYESAFLALELLRVSVDEYGLGWDAALSIVRETFCLSDFSAYTEELTRFPLSLYEQYLPRHLELLYEINSQFLTAVCEGDSAKAALLSCIEESDRSVRMSHVPFLSGARVAGAGTHRLIPNEDAALKEFMRAAPESYVMVRNGAALGRYLVAFAPSLARLISEYIGTEWLRYPEELEALEHYALDESFTGEMSRIKRIEKEVLVSRIKECTGVIADPRSLFDVQIADVNDANRQMLNLLHIITFYNRLKMGLSEESPARTFVFAGKVRPGCVRGAYLVKLIDSVARVINSDLELSGKIKIVFLPNISETLFLRIANGADLAQHLVAPGFDVGGPGAAAVAAHGVPIVGTLAGSNVGVLDAVGPDSFYLFGLTATEISKLKARGYVPWNYYQGNAELRGAIDRIQSGHFTPDGSELFKLLTDYYLTSDDSMVLADYQSYILAQERAGRMFRYPRQWTQMTIRNIAKSAKFSMHSSLRTYREKLWKVEFPSEERNAHSGRDVMSSVAKSEVGRPVS